MCPVYEMVAVGPGCDIHHASRLIYSRGLDLADLDPATPAPAARCVNGSNACGGPSLRSDAP